MRPFLPLLSLASMAQALYFFIDVTSPKCFFEELPKDTLVVGHYSTEEWNDNTHAWERHDGVSIYISVDVRPAPSPTIQSHCQSHSQPVPAFPGPSHPHPPKTHTSLS